MCVLICICSVFNSYLWVEKSKKIFNNFSCSSLPTWNWIRNTNDHSNLRTASLRWTNHIINQPRKVLSSYSISESSLSNNSNSLCSHVLSNLHCGWWEFFLEFPIQWTFRRLSFTLHGHYSVSGLFHSFGTNFTKQWHNFIHSSISSQRSFALAGSKISKSRWMLDIK